MYGRFRELRRENNLTLEAVAKILEISRSEYAAYERGLDEISIKLLIRLCRLYDVSVPYILGTSETREAYPPLYLK